jgi:hypothetical protein
MADEWRVSEDDQPLVINYDFLIMNMAVFFNNVTIANILYNEGTFLR